MEFTNGDVADAAAAPVDNGNEYVAQGSDNNDTGGNPAWKDVLEALPSSLHSVVTPHLQKWDQSVQKRFETVQSQYNPYKQFVEQGIGAQDIEASLALRQIIDSDPRAFYDKMTEYYGADWGINSGQGQTNGNADYSLDGEEDEEGQEFDLESNPLFKQVKEQQDIIAGFLASKVEQETQAAAQAEINQELAAVGAKYGVDGKIAPEDEKFVISIALQNNVNLAQAADMFFGRVGQAQQQQKMGNYPHIVPTTGGVPAQNFNPADLSQKQTRDLIAGMLAQAKDPNNQ